MSMVLKNNWWRFCWWWFCAFLGLLACLAVALLFAIITSGCQRGDFKIEPVVSSQPAPFDGYTISPEIYAEEGDAVQGTGVHLYIKGLDLDEIINKDREAHRSSVALREAGVR